MLEKVFGKYGKIQAKRIKRDKEGNYTKTAMICYKSEGEARNAVERMKENEWWEVNYFSTKTQKWPERTNKGEDNQKREGKWQDRTNKGEDNQKQGELYGEERMAHWSVQHPNFYNTTPNMSGETRTGD